jgi:uncharacterized protein
MSTAWHDLRPSLYPDPYVFAQVREVPAGISGTLGPFAVIREDEGTTLVLAQAQADRLGLPYGYVAARITLTIGSDLAAIGLTAEVSRVLAQAGISCNVIAGLAHDHLFVDFERGPEALGLLKRL